MHPSPFASLSLCRFVSSSPLSYRLSTLSLSMTVRNLSLSPVCNSAGPASVSIKGAGENPPRVRVNIYIYKHKTNTHIYICVQQYFPLAPTATGQSTRGRSTVPRGRATRRTLSSAFPRRGPRRETWARLILDRLSLITSPALSRHGAIYRRGRVQQPLSSAAPMHRGISPGRMLRVNSFSVSFFFFFFFYHFQQQFARAQTDKSINR